MGYFILIVGFFSVSLDVWENKTCSCWLVSYDLIKVLDKVNYIKGRKVKR